MSPSIAKSSPCCGSIHMPPWADSSYDLGLGRLSSVDVVIAAVAATAAPTVYLAVVLPRLWPLE